MNVFVVADATIKCHKTCLNSDNYLQLHAHIWYLPRLKTECPVAVSKNKFLACDFYTFTLIFCWLQAPYSYMLLFTKVILSIAVTCSPSVYTQIGITSPLFYPSILVVTQVIYGRCGQLERFQVGSMLVCYP